MRTSPVPGASSPARTRSIVVLPLPFSPTRPQCSPGPTRKLTSKKRSASPGWAKARSETTIDTADILPAGPTGSGRFRFRDGRQLATAEQVVRRATVTGVGPRSAESLRSVAQVPGGATSSMLLPSGSPEHQRGLAQLVDDARVVDAPGR